MKVVTKDCFCIREHCIRRGDATASKPQASGVYQILEDLTLLRASIPIQLEKVHALDRKDPSRLSHELLDGAVDDVSDPLFEVFFSR
jgi:hypothetical protein